MNGNEHIAVEDLALFALLLLGDDEAAAVRTHVQRCVLCAAELEQVREDLATYALATEPLPVPAEARNRFLASLQAEIGGQHLEPVSDPLRMPAQPAAGQTANGASGRPLPARTFSVKVLPWVGWAAAAAAVVAAVNLKGDRDQLRSLLQAEHVHTAALEASAGEARHLLGTLTDPQAVRVNLSVPKAPSTPAARATYEPKSGTILLIASNLQPLREQKVYELWLIPANGGSPIAAGTFSPDAHGNASLLVPALKGAVAAKAFGITAEPAGGSQTPTMPILLAGAPA